MRYTEFRSKSVESVKLWRMQLGGLESAYSLEHVLFRQSRQIVDLPISVRSASWFFCLGRGIIEGFLEPFCVGLLNMSSYRRV